jgi:plasmid stabilization system protein ParE
MTSFATWIALRTVIKLQVSKLARTQILDIGRYTRREFGAKQAKQLSSEFRKIFRQIADFPTSCPIEHERSEAQLRRAVLPPFVILYQVHDDGRIEIVLILHGARDRTSLDTLL